MALVLLMSVISDMCGPSCDSMVSRVCHIASVLEFYQLRRVAMANAMPMSHVTVAYVADFLPLVLKEL